MQAMYDTEEKPFILVVEGSITTADGGRCCEVGEKHGHGITAIEHVTRLGKKAKAVIAIGSCASFGGVPKANMNPSGAGGDGILQGAGDLHPDHQPAGLRRPSRLVHRDRRRGAARRPESVKVDEHGRPEMFYRKLIHDNCPLRGQFDPGKFAQKFGDEGCLYKLGCKGPVAHANCPEKRFNSGTNWCIENGHPCNGCVEPAYPFEESMWTPVPITGVTPPALYPPIFTDNSKPVDLTPGYTALAGAAAAVVGMKVLGKKRKGRPGPRRKE